MLSSALSTTCPAISGIKSWTSLAELLIPLWIVISGQNAKSTTNLHVHDMESLFPTVIILCIIWIIVYTVANVTTPIVNKYRNCEAIEASCITQSSENVN